jgi:hypothetical protein
MKEKLGLWLIALNHIRKMSDPLFPYYQDDRMLIVRDRIHDTVKDEGEV